MSLSSIKSVLYFGHTNEIARHCHARCNDYTPVCMYELSHSPKGMDETPQQLIR